MDNWQYERDSARASLLAAEARRDLAQLDLDYTQVTAPFDGRIDRPLRDPGNLVGVGEETVLAEINQIDPIYVYFTINERDVLRLREANWQISGAVQRAEATAVLRPGQRKGLLRTKDSWISPPSPSPPAPGPCF